MYRGEMGSRQFAQRPRSASQEKTGMFWYQRMRALHLGQCDGGLTMLSSRGIRQMHTFRTLATADPRKNAYPQNSQ